MFKVYSAQNIGLEAKIITVEVDTNKSLPGIEIIGLPDSSIKESRERIKLACKNTNFSFPPKKYIVNLAPSNVKKYGSRFDLAIATGLVLTVSSNCQSQGVKLSKTLIFGELGLDGSVKYIQGLLPTILSAKKQGRSSFIIPDEAVDELSIVQGVTFYPVKYFSEVLEFIQGVKTLKKLQSKGLFNSKKNSLSGKPQKTITHKIYGHELAKRVLKIAVLGKHNVLLIGSPGTGKTLLANYLGLLLPPLSYKESLAVTAIHSAAGKLPSSKVITNRPFIQAHSSISYGGMFGGGIMLTPGLISLAHHGVLFLDELGEFKRDILEGLRQPMQDKKIVISRLHGSVVYPSNCMIIATMNPCRCGYYGDSKKHCVCSSNDIKRYQAKISGPLLDRFDIIIDITRQTVQVDLKEKVYTENIEKIHHGIEKLEYIGHNLTLSKDCKETVKLLSNKFTLSGRVVRNLLNLSRSIACYEGVGSIDRKHILEAYQYRSMRMVVDL